MQKRTGTKQRRGDHDRTTNERLVKQINYDEVRYKQLLTAHRLSPATTHAAHDHPLHYLRAPRRPLRSSSSYDFCVVVVRASVWWVNQEILSGCGNAYYSTVVVVVGARGTSEDDKNRSYCSGSHAYLCETLKWFLIALSDLIVLSIGGCDNNQLGFTFVSPQLVLMLSNVYWHNQ